jgi:hypothetical protein
MNGVSEIKLDNTGSVCGLKTVQVAKSGSQSPTRTVSNVNKINVVQDTTSQIGGTRPDRVVPVDDLSLLVDRTKTKSDPFSLTSLSNATSASATPHSNTASNPPLMTITKSTPTTPTSMRKPSFLNETTDLSDILKKDSKTDFQFTPSINVSTNATLPTTTAPAKPVATTPAPVPAKTGFMSSLFGGTPTPAPAPAPTPTPTPATAGTTATATPATATKPATVPTVVPVPKTQAELLKEKQDLLFKLNRLQKAGMPVSQKYTMSSKLEDVKSEFTGLKYQRDLQNSVKFQRKMMMAVVTGVEFINTKFDPFDVKLDGWSESVHENVNDYDEIFEELHDKYKEKAKMAPETKLFFSLAGSAFMFHLTQSLFKTSPAIGDVMQQNPELMKQFAQAAVNGHNSQAQMPRAQAPPSMGGGGGLGGLFSGLMGGMGGGGMGGGTGSASESGSSYGESQIHRQAMSGPKNVDNILSQLSNNIPQAKSKSGGGGAQTSRVASVTKADEIDIAQLGSKMSTIDTASSGYRKKLTDGIKLDL